MAVGRWYPSMELAYEKLVWLLAYVSMTFEYMYLLTYFAYVTQIICMDINPEQRRYFNPSNTRHAHGEADTCS